MCLAIPAPVIELDPASASAEVELGGLRRRISVAPLDVLHATLMLMRQINAGEARVENQYHRAVAPQGNLKAQRLMAETFRVRERFAWRGLGELPQSALGLAETYAAFDAERRFSLAHSEACEVRGCDCLAILRGLMEASDCALFGTACTPEHPMGACMVSSEGACAADWSYGRTAP